jgi:hypothetical protein
MADLLCHCSSSAEICVGYWNWEAITELSPGGQCGSVDREIISFCIYRVRSLLGFLGSLGPISLSMPLFHYVVFQKIGPDLAMTTTCLISRYFLGICRYSSYLWLIWQCITCSCLHEFRAPSALPVLYLCLTDPWVTDMLNVSSVFVMSILADIAQHPPHLMGEGCLRERVSVQMSLSKLWRVVPHCTIAGGSHIFLLSS